VITSERAVCLGAWTIPDLSERRFHAKQPRRGSKSVCLANGAFDATPHRQAA
jgi:hypothetical protein